MEASHNEMNRASKYAIIIVSTNKQTNENAHFKAVKNNNNIENDKVRRNEEKTKKKYDFWLILLFVSFVRTAKLENSIPLP